MARKEDESRVRLTVDGKQAINELGKLEMEAKELAIDIKEAKKGTVDYVNASKKLKEAKAQIKGLRDEIGLSGMTLGQLVRHQRELKREITTTTTKGTAEYKKLKTELTQVNGLVRQQRVEMNSTGTAFNSMTANIVKTAGAFGLFFGAMEAINQFKNLIGIANNFEQSMSNLSAITGASGDDLQYLSDKAREMGATTTLSAQQTAEAFEIIASKKPELLDNVEALTATTEATILLAEAAGIDLPTAAEALTNTLNQFGEGADQATRFVNTLAAGSKFGAGNIEFLNDAVKRFGPIADTMNLSMEQSVAMMEVFAEKGLESEKAGTQFRNILLRLASGADETNPAVVGLGTAIENLGQKQLNTAEMAKLFGVENVLAGQIMVQSGERFAEFTKKVTGTEIALEQARVRIDNTKGDLKQLSSITQEYAITIGGLISQGLRPLIQGFTAFLLGLKELPKFINENKGLLITFTTALISLNSAQIISTGLMLKDIIAKKAQIIWTTATTIAQNGLNAAMTANPIGLIIKATALLVSGFALLYNSSEKVRGAISGIGEVASTVWNIIKETLGNFTGAFSKILDGDIIGGIKDLGKALIKANPVSIAINEGERLGTAFMKGYNDKIASEKPETLQVNQAGIDTPSGDTVDSIDTVDTTGVPGDVNAAKEKLTKLTDEWAGYQQRISDLTRQYALAHLSDEDKEQELIWEKYSKLEEDLIHHLNKTITEDEFHENAKKLENLRKQELGDIRSKYAETEAQKRKEAEEKITEATIEEKELAKLKINQHYDELISLAAQFGLSSVGIEEARRRELSELQSKYDRVEIDNTRKVNEAKIMIAQSVGQSLGAVIDFVGAKSGELTTFQKLLVGAQIAADTAASLGRIVPLAAEAAKGTGPAAPFVFAGYVAAMGATVLTAIGKAKQALSDSSVPEWKSSSSDAPTSQRRATNVPVSSYYYGGDTGKNSIGFGDKNGSFAGYVHENEYVIPSFIRSHPFVANVLPAIEAIREEKTRGAYRGGQSSSPNTPSSPVVGNGTSGKADPEMLSLLKSIDSKLDKMPTRVKAYLVDSEMQEFQTIRDNLEKRYSA